ncbi:MAG: hypothetical protein FWG35_06320, partial [Spirochaetaceae bacterium]|nr:hypothetical protein [Spirochaetaceae bacterium]
HPLGKDGGITVMGKITYWDPFIEAAKQFVEEARYIKTAPYIRSGAITAWYNFGPDLKWNLSGFFGSDGIGAVYENEVDDFDDKSWVNMRFFWDNRLGFLTTGLTWNPSRDTALTAVAGTGLLRADLEGKIGINYTVRYGDDFSDKYPVFGILPNATYHIEQDNKVFLREQIINYQGRLDFDWDLGSGFLFAVGVQELYSQWLKDDSLDLFVEQKVLLGDYGYPAIDGYISFPIDYAVTVRNHGYTTSGYTLLEYTTDDKRFGAELGLRVDHVYFVGRDFTIQTRPVPNPRLNLDFVLIQAEPPIDSLSLTLGTGLFSSMNSAVQFLQARSGIENYQMRQNRSWTSVAGTKIDFTDGLSLSIEGYYKYVFDRAYMYADVSPANQELIFMFDGRGHVWGFDLMLQKFTSRWWDGWISYSFNFARYKNPQGTDESVGEEDATGRGWFFPPFHRFHTLNLVLNLKPVKSFNIATRLSFASGIPKSEVDNIEVYPVILDPGGPNEQIIAKYKRHSSYSNTLRTGFSLPIDVKFSFFRFNKKGKVQSEIYLAIENIQALLYKPKANTTFNAYTGKEDKGSDQASYDMPIPMPSFGFKWSY